MVRNPVAMFVAAMFAMAANGETPSVKPFVPAPPKVSAPFAPNTLRHVKLTSAQQPVVGEIYGGNDIGFFIKGTGSPANPDKCVVQVRFDRAPSVIYPKAKSYAKEYTLPEPETHLQTDSPVEGGDWTFQLSTVKNCTGGPFGFNAKVKFSPDELDPKLISLGGPVSPIFIHGQTRHITITGKGDLANCMVELNIDGPVINPGKRIVAMSGKLTVNEPITANFPPANKPGSYPGSYVIAQVTAKPLSGCTLYNAVDAAQGQMKAYFNIWTTLS